MLRHFVFTAVVALALTGCQSSMIRSFENIHNGMDKHQVLESLGTPNSSIRMHGKDRWMYRFYEDGIRFDKEVHFLDNTVVYIGESWNPPEKNAAVVDKKNEEIEATLQAEEKARDEERKNNANRYLEYEQSARNNDKVRYMPDFIDLK